MLSITIAGGKGIGALRAQNTCHDVNRKYVLNNSAVRAMGNDERAICDLLDAFAHAICLKDSVGAIAPLADDAVTFDLAPPLQQGPEVTHDPDRLEEGFATWEGPLRSAPLERRVATQP